MHEYNVYVEIDGKWTMINESAMTREDAEALMEDTEGAGMCHVTDMLFNNGLFDASRLTFDIQG